MSSPSDAFECRWHGSRRLLVAYWVALALALVSLWHVDLPVEVLVLAALALVAHAAWVLPRCLWLSHPDAAMGARYDSIRGWQLYSRAQGWYGVRLCDDSVVLPAMIVLRCVPDGSYWARTHCIAADALAPDVHRRLRVRLRFARRRPKADT